MKNIRFVRVLWKIESISEETVRTCESSCVISASYLFAPFLASASEPRFSSKGEKQVAHGKSHFEFHDVEREPPAALSQAELKK
jgi:hypothetical protein